MCVAETVPIEHETRERVVRTLAFALPPAALAVGGWLALGGPANAGLHPTRALRPGLGRDQDQSRAPTGETRIRGGRLAIGLLCRLRPLRRGVDLALTCIARFVPTVALRLLTLPFSGALCPRTSMIRLLPLVFPPSLVLKVAVGTEG
jgi:hypothetical protein